MPEPLTEAGRRLVSMLYSDGAVTYYNEPLATVYAIEAEARVFGQAEAVARIRAAVEGLPIWLPGTQSPRLHGSPEADDYWREVVALPAVLAIIDGDAG